MEWERMKFISQFGPFKHITWDKSQKHYHINSHFKTNCPSSRSVRPDLKERREGNFHETSQSLFRASWVHTPLFRRLQDLNLQRIWLCIVQVPKKRWSPMSNLWKRGEELRRLWSLKLVLQAILLASGPPIQTNIAFLMRFKMVMLLLILIQLW